MTEEATKSYIDFLVEGEILHRSIEDVCIQMEKEGWRVHKRTARGLRYWCPCDRQHNIWIDLAPLKDERLDFILKTTCLTFN